MEDWGHAAWAVCNTSTLEAAWGRCGWADSWTRLPWAPSTFQLLSLWLSQLFLSSRLNIGPSLYTMCFRPVTVSVFMLIYGHPSGAGEPQDALSQPAALHECCTLCAGSVLGLYLLRFVHLHLFLLFLVNIPLLLRYLPLCKICGALCCTTGTLLYKVIQRIILVWILGSSCLFFMVKKQFDII